MDRVRPSLRELQAGDVDKLDFSGAVKDSSEPAVKVKRARPPRIASTSLPAPVPIVPQEHAQEQPPAPEPRPSKPKSRFALQREQQMAERAASNRPERFTIDMDDDDNAPVGPLPGAPRLIGNVLERDASSAAVQAPTRPGPAAPSPLASRPSGFPASSRMLFPRKPRQALGQSSETVAPPEAPFDRDANSVPDLLASVSAENDKIVAGMSEADIIESQRQIKEELGLSEDLIRMLEARGRRKAESRMNPVHGQGTTLRPHPAKPPKSRQPVSPVQAVEFAEEEGSPEYIRRHFFPNEPPNPNLDWMRPRSATRKGEIEGSTAIFFDLQGRLTRHSDVADQMDKTATHHVSSAGTFSVPSLMSLVSSAVPSQRMTALTVLERILSHKDNVTALGPDAWKKLRLDAATKAGVAVGDAHVTIAGAALRLAAKVLADEPRVPPAVTASGVEAPPTALSCLLASGLLASMTRQLEHPRLPSSDLCVIVVLLDAIVDLANPRSPTKSVEIDSLVQQPSLLEFLGERFIAKPWPAMRDTGASQPVPAAIRLLDTIARSSRTSAKAIWKRSLVEPTLRFLSVPPWELGDNALRTAGQRLLLETIRLWTTLARYGIATSLRARGASIVDALVEHVASLFDNVSRTMSSEDRALARATFKLLDVWTVAAIDPHITGHDITWSQVEDWGQSAMSCTEWALAQEPVDRESLALGTSLLASWITGSKVNKSWRGEQERESVQGKLGPAFEPGGKAFAAFHLSLRTMAQATGSTAADDIGLVCQVVWSILRMSEAYKTEDSTPHLLELAQDIDWYGLSRLLQSRAPSRAFTGMLLALLPRIESQFSRMRLACQVVAHVQAGQEVALRDELDWIMNTFAEEGRSSSDVASKALANTAILRPFLRHAIVSGGGGRVTGPEHPSPRDIKLTSVQHPFVRDSPVLRPNWPLSAFDELLQSATSPVFQHLPKDWDASELDVVRTSLSLMLAVIRVDESLRPAGSDVVYDLIKIFMLEKDSTVAPSNASPAIRDVFRDEVVGDLMSDFVKPLRLASQTRHCVPRTNGTKSIATLETVSAKYSSAPFYQLYTDLVGLFDSISLGHELFSLVLLPPLAMTYPHDYRRLLWLDYAQVLPGIQLNIGQAISDADVDTEALGRFLYPVEDNETVLGAYVAALATGKVEQERNEFLYFVAVHHVSKVVFGSSREGAIGRRLIDGLIRTGSAVLRRVLAYEQAEEEGAELILPPMCFVEGGKAYDARQAHLFACAGDKNRDRVEHMLA